ncbi:MAG: efflux RND transporter permease subunit, partial [Elusimicrobiota bacterium]|nr:efflux RND transporter permease subunit [Elusimicrobiota bacterium]
LVVFTPIVMMGGIIGMFMKHFGMTVIYMTLFSILASFTLTPMMCALLMKSKSDQKSQKTKGFWSKIASSADKFQKFLLTEYKKIFDKVEKHPYFTTLLCSMIFVSIIFPLKYMGSEFMPVFDEDVLSISVELPQGKNVNDTLEKVKQVEDIVSKLPETVSYLSYIGTDSEEMASMKINLKPLKEREKGSLKLIDDLIPKISAIPGADIVLSGSSKGGSMLGGDLSINVYGKEYDKIIELSNKMMAVMEQTGNFRSVESSYKKPKKEIRFIPDDNQMVRAGVRNSQAGDAVSFSIKGNDKNLYKEGGEEYKININLDDEYQKTLEDIGKISVMSKDGLLQISKLGNIQKVPGYSEIMRRDRTRVININGFLSKSTAGEMEALLNREFKKMDFQEGYGYKYVGRSEMMEDSVKEIVKAFVLAVILTYMLLAAIMNSFLYPFVIAVSVAMSMLGALYLMFFLDYSVSMLAMMSMIMLVGLSVNNGILMLDYALQRRAEGVPIIEALWQGASVKFRSILMTSLAIILGTLPQLFDPFQGKAVMGGVIIGGVMASIIFTFILTPALFTIFERMRKFSKSEKVTKGIGRINRVLKRTSRKIELTQAD